MARSLLEDQMKGATKQAKSFVRQLKRGARVSLGQTAGAEAGDQLVRDFATEAARSGS